MANGRSPLPTTRRTPCAMPVMPLPASTPRHARSQTINLLQPHRDALQPRLSDETLSSAASSNRDLPSSRQLHRQPSPSIYSPTSHDQLLAPTSQPRQHPVRPPLFHRHTSPSVPPMRNLPPLRTSDEALYRFGADELDEVSPGGDVTTPAGLDLSLGRLYGFPYCMGVPNGMEDKAKAVAEAEEAEYQRERSRRRGARLSGRLGSALKGFAVSRSLSRPRSDVW